MTTYCPRCKNILNQHPPKFCPECGEATEKEIPDGHSASWKEQQLRYVKAVQRLRAGISQPAAATEPEITPERMAAAIDAAIDALHGRQQLSQSQVQALRAAKDYLLARKDLP